MNKPLITVCVVNYNSADFVELLLFSLKRLTHYPYKVIIRDNNSASRDYLKLQNIVSHYGDYVTLYRVETDLVGSLAHSTALNELINKIDTEYGVIVDADVAFLVKDWDKLLIERLTDEMPIYGTQADIGGGKPEDFPLMFAVCFKTEILKRLNIDFRPKDLSKKQDTGWELREKYLNNGLKGGLLYDHNTRHFKNGPFCNVICSEYYLDQEAKTLIFASHFGRGSSPKSKNLIKLKKQWGIIARLINYILYYPNILKWKYDKMRWLSICRTIIKK